MLGSGVPQVVSRQCCAHLAQEACALADANPDGFMALAEFALDKMQAQVLSTHCLCRRFVFSWIAAGFVCRAT